MALSGTSVSPTAGEVFALIRDRGAITRSEIGRITGLSRTAVTARVAALEADDLVIEPELAASTGGRPATQVVFNVDAGIVYAAAGSVMTVLLGRRLVPLNYRQADREADFRAELIHVRENAESIALHDLCQAHGIPVWHGGMLESGIGRAHNIHLSTLPNFSKPGDTSSASRYFTRAIIVEHKIVGIAIGQQHVDDVPLDGVGPLFQAL